MILQKSRPKPALRGFSHSILFFLFISFAVMPSSARSSENYLKGAERYVSSMRLSLDRIAERIRKAIEKGDLALVNCLRKKEQQMKIYFDASLRTQENLRSAWKAHDRKESERFLKLVELAQKKVKEIEESIKECYSADLLEEATRVEVIRPEGAIEDELIDSLFPEQGDGTDEEMPAVPPASPFR